MSLSLRMVLLGIALISLLGIIIASIRRKYFRKHLPYNSEAILSIVKNETYDDGIIGPVRIIKSAEHYYQKPTPTTKLTPITDEPEPALEQSKMKATPYLQMASHNELIVFYIMPKSTRKIGGLQLKDCLFNLGFEYGQMQIFNFYESKDNIKDLQFCLASAFEPGKFDLQTMSQQQFNGLCCFMSARHRHATKALNTMLIKIEQLAYELNANICDDKRQLSTNTYIAACRSRASKLS